MNNSNHQVQNWLDQCETELLKLKHRAPFSDLEVNKSLLKDRAIKNRTDHIFNKLKENEHSTSKKSRKRPNVKTPLSADKSQLNQFFEPKVKGKTTGWKSVKRLKKEFEECEREITEQKKSIKDESGIVKDCETISIEDTQDYKTITNRQKNESGIVKDAESILIEDSPVNEIDKDYLAWLAVLNASENETPTCSQLGVDSQLKCKELINYTNDIEATPELCHENFNLQKENTVNILHTEPNQIKIPHAIPHKVPFLKRGPLQCLSKASNVKDKLKTIPNNPNKYKQVSINIETDSLITNITVSRLPSNQLLRSKKVSKPVQTDSKPVQTYSKPGQTDSKPVQTSSTSVLTDSKPVQTCSKPVRIDSKPVQTDSKPVQTYSMPVQTDSKPVQTSSTSVLTDSKPVQTYSKPIRIDSKPVQTDSKPAKKDTKLSQTDSKLSQTDAKPVQTDSKHEHKHSSTAQIYVNKNTLIEHCDDMKEQNCLEISSDVESQDLFTDEQRVTEFGVGSKDNETVASEWSSDSECEQHISLEIAADVHRSEKNEERPVLGELLPGSRVERPVIRAYSPESSNSSDKENRDPNTMKKRRHPKDSKKKTGVLAKKSHRF